MSHLVAAAGHQRLAHSRHGARHLLAVQDDVRVGSVLQNRQRQLVNAQNVGRHAADVLNHLHNRLEDVL